MQTILKLLGFASLAHSEHEILDLIDQESERCINSGNLLGAGEWYVSKLSYCKLSEQADSLLAKTIAFWASPLDLTFSPTDLKNLASNIPYFPRDVLAAALIAITARQSKGITQWSSLLKDMAFRLSPELKKILQLKDERPIDLLHLSATKMKTFTQKCEQALTLFQGARCISARIAAIDVIRVTRQMKPYLLPRERPILSQVEMLLGGAFREFCQAYERSENEKVMSHLNEIRQEAEKIAQSQTHENSVVWHAWVKPVAEHVVSLTDEATQSCKLAVTPDLKLSSNVFKVDLLRPEGKAEIVTQLTNRGPGSARRITIDASTAVGDWKVVSPRDEFDLSGSSDMVVVLELTVNADAVTSGVPIAWRCTDVTGRTHVCEDVIRIEQQRKQPDWDVLLADPPYTVNPIRSRERLFGREAQLSDLLLNSAAGTSTFIWGQKRVGKTSLLQVLSSELAARPNVRSVLLRMGELIGLHEGQIAHTVALRLTAGLPGFEPGKNSEAQFGAGLGKLVPFMEEVVRKFGDIHFVVIIDEFDDLDPAFYTGERGRIFIKALRTLSEIGLTFLFAGSERMNVIYAKHSQELNKWTNMFLDSIASRQDCRDLISKPVENAIEYQVACIDAITDYCRGNPFFMHLVCQALFKHCVAERRTYVGEADFRNEQELLSETLGQSNFAHLWEDNPILDKGENFRFAAENCLALCCIASLRGTFLNPEQVWEQQDSLNLTSTERLSLREMSMIVERLRTRKIITDMGGDRRIRLHLPIFSHWLQKNAELSLLPTWRRFISEKSESAKAETVSYNPRYALVDSAFPIPEDALLPLSQRLIFCGKQKDVTEIRVWLRQFDDDNRIEIAFLLLKRLVDKGYINAGEREYALSKLADTINAMRLKVGSGKWNVMRGRKDDLCISYVDSELKSGATLARELVKRMNPGKAGNAKEVSNWLRAHVTADPVLILVDDFAGTGTTVAKGFQKWREDLKDDRSLQTLLDQGRVGFAVLHGFGESIDQLRKVESKLQLFFPNLYGAEVRAFDPDANIFQSSQERDFAKEVMLQIGRELTPQMPLGFGDQAGLVAFHNSVPNNTLPIFWSNGRVNERNWVPLFPRA
jgi:hypothetical protein